MVSNTEQTKIEVLLDGRQASDQLKELTQQSAALRVEMKKAYDANDAGKVAETEWELSKLDSRMKQLRKESVDVTSVLDNLSGSTMSELRQAISSVDAKLASKSLKRNSEEWQKLINIRQILVKQQKELRTEISGTDSVLKKSSGILNQHNLLLGGTAAALFKIQGEARKSLQAYNNFEDGFQNLSALTGLTGDSLDYLKEKAKETSTATLEGGIRVRQGASAILDAYTMIGSQRPELLKNKEALHEVTTEAIILSEAAKMDLKPAAAALTNSLNQFNATSDQARRYVNALAAGSQAGAGDINYLSQAVEKAGTTSNLMGLEFEQLVALVEVAAPKYKEAAVAGNSLDKVLLEMKAKQIGYRDGVFDVNLALEELADRFASGETSVEIFGKEHSKMVEILVNERQEYARYVEAVTGTNTAIEQAATNTDTNKVKTQQYLNELEKVRIEIGEKLTPGIGLLTRGGTSLLKVFSALVDIANNFGWTLAGLVTTVTILVTKEKILHGIELLRNIVGEKSVLQGRAKILAMNGEIAGLKLKALFTKQANVADLVHIQTIRQKIVAMKTANATLARTPWGLIAVGATMVIGLFVDLIRNTNQLSESQQRLVDIEKRHTETLRDQTGQMSMLFAQIKKTNPGTEERITLVNRLAGLMPDVIDKHKLYNAELKELQQAETDYRLELEKRIRVQANEDKFTDLVKQQMETEEALEKGKIKIEKLKKDRESIMKYGSAGALAGMNSKIYKAENDVQSLENALDEINKSKAKISMEFGKTEEEPSPVKKFPMVKIETDEDWTDEAIKEIDAEINKSEELQKIQSKRIADQKKYREEVLFNSRSALEQEDSLYEERLKKAGLFGKQEIVLDSEDALVSEALHKEHQAKILKIENDAEKKVVQSRQAAINKQIEDSKAANQREIDELKIKHTEELSNSELNASEVIKIKKRQHQEEQDLAKEQTKKLMHLVQQIISGEDIPGINLADKILSPEEKQKLENELLELRKKLAELGIIDPPKNEKDEWSGVDILGMSEEDWETLNNNLKDGEAGLAGIQAGVGVLMNVWGTYNNMVAAFENKQLKEFEKNSKKKKAALDKQLDAGEISQEQYTARVAQLDAELDAKKSEIENKQAKRQKAISIFEALVNTAVAVAAALKIGWPLGPILAAITGVLGAAQVATITATPLPGAEDGGFLNVVRSQDGRTFMAKNDPDHRGYVDSPTVITGESGREFVVNDEAVSNPTIKPVLDVIDTAQKNGTIDRLDLTRYISTVLPGRVEGGKMVSSRTDSPVAANTLQVSDPEMKILLRENIKMMKVLENKKLVLAWYGKGSVKEMMEKSSRYEQKISGQ